MSITQEEQRCALADIQSKKDELERQKKMLEAAVQKTNTVQEAATDFIVTPYTSNFLQVGLRNQCLNTMFLTLFLS
jgi:Na+-transporting NADH:ubiquinone oxidoreductase subunit NqrC